MKFSISEISNNDISGTGCPINFVFDSGVGFLGWRIEWVYFLYYNPPKLLSDSREWIE